MKNSLRENEKGLVSIVITMIFMIIITLIVIGFAQLARREQRQALDRQLSAQAQYAAESGINTARRHLANYPAYEKTDCKEDTNGDPDDLNSYENQLDSTGNIAITCLLIDNESDNLEFSSVLENKSTVSPVLPDANPSELTIEWKDAAGIATSDTPPADLPDQASWGGSTIGMLRIDLVNTNTPGDISSGGFTAFLKPAPSGTANITGFTTAASDNGKIQQGACDAGRCTVVINNLPASQKFAIRMTAIYRSVGVKITGKDGLGNNLNFSGQPKIDVTARAADVLRRIRARSPSSGFSNGNDVFPEFALDSAGGLCKQIKTAPSPYVSTDTCTSAPGAFTPPTYAP